MNDKRQCRVRSAECRVNHSRARAQRKLGRSLVLGTWHLVLLFGLTACTDLAGYDLDRFWGYLPFMSVLREGVEYDPYDMPRLPAEGAIPVATPMGDLPPAFTQSELDSVAATLTNPLSASAAVLARGKLAYERQCSACHGPAGAGNGPVVGRGKFPFAAALNGEVTAGRSDGYIYAVTRVGRGLMPAYGDRLTEHDRWAVVHYVRTLHQRAEAAGLQPVAPANTSAVPNAGVVEQGPVLVPDNQP